MLAVIKRELWLTISKPLLLSLGFLAFIFILIPLMTVAVFYSDLQSKETIMNRNNRGLTLLDRFEKPFFKFYEVREIDPIPLANIPKHMQYAVIAIEDKDFYKHSGFSIKAILRAIATNTTERRIVYGASTINQQLVKNSLLNLKKNFLRKYQELVLAYVIDRKYSKDEILEMYLNSVFFGEGAFGVEEAAETYFGKTAGDLNLAEASFLAGILPAPSRLSPLSNDIKLAKERQLIVLQVMEEQGYIDSAQKENAGKEELVFKPTKEIINVTAPHFALMVKDELTDKYGEEGLIRSGFKVKTTLNLGWQQFAETIVENQVDRLAGNKVSNGAAVAILPKSGEVVVLVGSKNWNENTFGKLNMATSPRQPGSAYKPLIYSTGFEQKIITASTILEDKQKTYNYGYKPKNFDNKFRGNVTVRRALANSLNIPSIEVMEKVGVVNGLDMSRRFGISTIKDDSDYGISLVLGAAEVPLVEMTSVYSVFANYGVRNTPYLISEITDKRGEVIFTREKSSEEVISPEAAYLITSILTDRRMRREVFGSALDTSVNAAVKTGTTNDFRDALTFGYTRNITVGVWIGNNNNKPMSMVAGSLGAAPIWRQLIERYMQELPNEQFFVPSGLVKSNRCFNGLGSGFNASSSSQLEYFIKGTEGIEQCSYSTDTNISPPNQSPSPAPEENKSEDNKSKEEPTPTNTRSPSSTITPFPTPTKIIPVATGEAELLEN